LAAGSADAVFDAGGFIAGAADYAQHGAAIFQRPMLP